MNDDQPVRIEEVEFLLWGCVDLPIWMLHEKPCAVCGAPSKVATRRLNEPHRRFLCDAHRSSK